MKNKMPLTQFIKNCIALVFVGLNLISLSACGQKASSDFYWYEEAKQDDGSIIVVKKIESNSSFSRKEPGSQNYGYRRPRVELTDPKTGKPILWYPVNLPALLPYALHVHDKVPYMFATFYLGAYGLFGCPIPPYIVFRWEGDKWKRIAMTELPKQFKRRNLLDGAATKIYDGQQWKFIQSGDKVNAESIEQYVRSISELAETGRPYDIYEREIQHKDIGIYEECNGLKNFSTKYDNVELK
jgi:hypothetical protein